MTMQTDKTPRKIEKAVVHYVYDNGWVVATRYCQPTRYASRSSRVLKNVTCRACLAKIARRKARKKSGATA